MFDRHRKPARLLAATLAGAVLFFCAPASAEEAHGVIAFGETDQGDGVAYGFAWNFPAKDTAHAEALKACTSSGGTNCIQLAWFQNGCGALAIDQYGNAQGKPGMSREQAEARALRTCEAAGGAGCNIVGSLCATADGDPGTWSGSESVLAMPEEPRGPTDLGTAGRDGSEKTDATRDEALTREERIRVQRGLAALGFDTGPPDGMFGPRTRSAIWEWQQAKGLEATGYLTREEAEALAASAGAIRGERREPQDASRGARAGNQVLYLAAAGPKCPGMSEGSSCWRELSNKPGCYVWLHSYDPSFVEFEWSGACSGDTAHGTGTLHWSGPDSSGQSTGEIVHGKSQGHWVFRRADGSHGDGPYVDGKLHGHWVLRFADGSQEEGSFVDNKRHGHWVLRWADGSHGEGPYVDGKLHGTWVRRWADGRHAEGEFRNGKFEGERRALRRGDVER